MASAWQRTRSLRNAVALAGAVALATLMYATSAGRDTQVTPVELYVAPTGSDSNPGTAERPFGTLGRADRAAGPGTTVRVAAGTYGMGVTTSASGTSAARVRFISTARWAAKIQTSGVYRAWLNTGNYVDIVGFDITAPDAHIGIQNDASNVRIRSNHVHDVAATVDANGCDANGGAGIANTNYSAGYNEISGNLVHDVGDHTNTAALASCWAVHGIYESTSDGAILGNVACHNEAFGIHLWHAATTSVVSNNRSFANGIGGLQIGAGDAPGGVTSDNDLIASNILLDNGLFAIRAAGSLGTHNRFVDNVTEHGSVGWACDATALPAPGAD